ncbi:MAG TPA: NAD(P)-binding protein, partial [Polyangiales bacterium]|nr:NAD(P)-binding protein [Polyangiales bacterium]
MSEHAVVLGAGMGGLLAARVLRDHFRRVTLIERDQLPELGASRKGVPQDRHAHGLLARGSQIVEQLFPGFQSDIKLLGAQIATVMRDGVFVLDGQRLARMPGDDMTTVLCTRAMLEGYLRQRLLEEGGVRLRGRTEATGLIGDFSTVRGVRLRDLERDHGEEFLEAALVVDATGRGSRFASWLEQMGHRRPPEERIQIDLGYASAFYRRKPSMRLGTMVSVAPPGRRSGVALAVDPERFLVTLGGYLGEHPLTDHSSMREFARGLPCPDIAELLEGAEPLSAPAVFKYKHSRRL